MGLEILSEQSRKQASIDFSHYPESQSFRLTDGVQVRREKFGLLFYSYRGPRLYFVSSKDLIGDHFFDGKQTLGELAKAVQNERGLPFNFAKSHLARILLSLEAKGLIYGEQIC